MAPTWLAGNVSIKMLQILHLEKCKEWRILPLQSLQFLRKLKMIRMWNLTEISIPSLEELVLIEMPRLENCLGTYGIELTSQLRVIIIKGCPQLNEFTLFQSYSSFHAEQQSWFPFLSKLVICYCPHIMNWEILSLGGMHVLKELKLMDLHLVRELSVSCLEKPIPNLMSFIVATSWKELLLQHQGTCEIWSRLKRLEIIGDASVLTMSLCKQLKSLQYLDFWGKIMSPMVSLTEEQEKALQLLTSLRELHFGGYPNLLLLPADLRSLVFLKSLRICSCPSISRLPKMPASCDIYVHGCSEELAQRFQEWELRRREMIDDEICGHVWSEELAQQLEVWELQRMEMIVDEIVNH